MNSGDDLQPRPDSAGEPSRRLDPSLDRQQERQHREYVERTLREGRDPKGIRGPQNYVDTRDSYQKSRDQGLNFAVGMDHLEGRTRKEGWTPEKPMSTPLGRRVHDNSNEKERRKIEYKSGVVDEKAVLQLAKDRAALEAGFTVEWILAPNTRWDPLAKTRLRALEERYPGQFTSREVTVAQYEQAMQTGGEIRAREAQEKAAREQAARDRAAAQDKARADQIQQIKTHAEERTQHQQRIEKIEAITRQMAAQVEATVYVQDLLKVTHDPHLSVAQAREAKQLAVDKLTQIVAREREALTKAQTERDAQAQLVEQQLLEAQGQAKDGKSQTQDRARETEQQQDRAEQLEQALQRFANQVLTEEVSRGLDVLDSHISTLEIGARMDAEHRERQREQEQRMKERDRQAKEKDPSYRKHNLAEVARLLNVPYQQSRDKPLTPAQTEQQLQLIREALEARGIDAPEQERGIDRGR